jgi:general secretion pathway protein J
MKPSNAKMLRTDRRAGFTLIEALAAVAVTASLTASVLPYFVGLMSRWSSGEASVQRQDQWMQAILRLSKDLGEALPLTIGLGTPPRCTFQASSNSVVLVHEAVSDAAKLRLETVWLTIETSSTGDALLRSASDFDADHFNAKPQGASTVLVAGNFHLSFSIVDSKGRRRSEWLTAEELPTRIDLAIRPLAAGAPTPSWPIMLPLSLRVRVQTA